MFFSTAEAGNRFVSVVAEENRDEIFLTAELTMEHEEFFRGDKFEFRDLFTAQGRKYLVKAPMASPASSMTEIFDIPDFFLPVAGITLNGRDAPCE